MAISKAELPGIKDKKEITGQAPLTVFLDDPRAKDVSLTGGKGASLAELSEIPGIRVPPGYIVTTAIFDEMLGQNPVVKQEIQALDGLSVTWFRSKSGRPEEGTDALEKQIKERGERVEDLIKRVQFSPSERHEIADSYKRSGNISVAVRSTNKAEDGKEKSSAGQYKTLLNQRGEDQVIDAVRDCMSSQFTRRVVVYRNEARLGLIKKALEEHGDLERAIDENTKYSHEGSKMAVVVQKMIKASGSGTGFSVDPVTGEDVICIDFNNGIGESVVSGEVTPDGFRVDPKTFEIIDRRLGKKTVKTVFNDSGTETVPASEEDQKKYCVSDEEVIKTAKSIAKIKEVWGKDVDCEFALDEKRDLYFTQRRDVTTVDDPNIIKNRRNAFKDGVLTNAKVILEGGITGAPGVSEGKKLFAHTVDEAERKLETEEYKGQDVILIANMTSPDWVPIMKRVKGMLIRHGGRTCHAAIVSRELGVPALVGTEEAIDALNDDGGFITMDADNRKVYEGKLPLVEVGADWDVREIQRNPIKTKLKVNVLMPEESDKLRALGKLAKKSGVGLVRAEFSFRELLAHLNGLVDFENNVYRFANDKNPERGEAEQEVKRVIAGILERFEYRSAKEFVIDQHVKRIGRIASNFPNSDVTYRTNDFKTDEYEGLVGSDLYETKEANPMNGWRGLVRFLHPDNQEVFRWELEAIKRVREKHKNVQIMFPVVRDPMELNGTREEMKREYGKGFRSAYDIMEEVGLERGVDGLKVGIMVEVQANAKRFKDFVKAGIDFGSIGSNDLTQDILMADRNNGRIQAIKRYSESNEAVLDTMVDVVKMGHEYGVEIGVCGDAVSSNLKVLEALVEAGIDSVSLTPDFLYAGYKKILEIEKKKLKEQGVGETVLYEAPLKVGGNGNGDREPHGN